MDDLFFRIRSIENKGVDYRPYKEEVRVRHAEVLLESYNQDALEKGLGVKMHAISHEQLGKLLSHALGYVDYTDPGIANELMKLLE